MTISADRLSKRQTIFCSVKGSRCLLTSQNSLLCGSHTKVRQARYAFIKLVKVVSLLPWKCSSNNLVFIVDAENVCKDVKTSSVLLSIEEDSEDKPLFACPVSPDQAGTVSGGDFADMRKALLLLHSKDAALVSRVTVLSIILFYNDCCLSGKANHSYVGLILIGLLAFEMA